MCPVQIPHDVKLREFMLHHPNGTRFKYAEGRQPYLVLLQLEPRSAVNGCTVGPVGRPVAAAAQCFPSLGAVGLLWCCTVCSRTVWSEHVTAMVTACAFHAKSSRHGGTVPSACYSARISDVFSY